MSCARGPAARSALAPAGRAPVALALAVGAVLVAAASGYGPHRDELYFLAAGEHLAWGYPDQGPLTPAIARAMQELAAGSLTVLRVPSALAAAGVVLLTGLLARELGGGRRAQTIAAACAAVSSVVLIVGHLLSTTTFDLLIWTAITWLVVRALRTGDGRLWLVAGVVLGLGLLNKPLPAFLAAGLLGGVLIAGPRRLLRSRWVWAGAALAAVLWAPWLIWQASNGWPQLEVSSAIAEGGSISSEPRWAFLPFQLLLVSPLLAAVWIAGLVRLLRDPDLREYRFLAWTWALLAAAFLVTAGKPYYLAGLFPALLAAGSLTVDGWLERGRQRLRRAALVGAVVASGAVAATLGLPLLPADGLGPVLALNEDVGETVGWPELAAQVAQVRADLPGGDRAVILTANYGEAGAIDRYGLALGLPAAYSGHNGYGLWRVPPGRRGPVIVVGEPPGLERALPGCRVRARVSNRAGVDNEEAGAPIRTCSAPRRPWRELWPRLRRLG